jgi:protein phosphatase
MEVHSSRYTWSQLSDIGKRKPSNEDFVDHFIPENIEDENKSGSLFIVADGVGGSSFGEKASEYTVHKVLYEYYQSSDVEPGERLVNGIKRANSDIFLHSREISVDLMGTTVVAAAIRGNELVVANVGDSRGYLIRGPQIKQITHDHSLVQQMVDDHQLTEAEARSFKKKNVILRSVGAEDTVDVDIFSVDLIDGDVLLLCSDGLHKYFPDSAEIAEIIQSETIPSAAQHLVDLANNRGGSDNISVILVQVGDRVLTNNKMDAKCTREDSTQTSIPKGSKLRRPRWLVPLLVLIVFLILLVVGYVWLHGRKMVLDISNTSTPTIVHLTEAPTQIPVIPLSTVTPVADPLKPELTATCTQ